MGDGGAGDADHTAVKVIDAESGELLVVKGDIPGGNYEVIGPYVQNVFLRDREGNEVKVNADGSLRVSRDEEKPLPHQWAQLTAAGTTAAFEVAHNRYHLFQIVLANKDTSVDVRAEGSATGDGPWFNLDDAGVDTQYTANGTYPMHKSGFRCSHVRFNFVAEAGGAAATLDVTYWGGR